MLVHSKIKKVIDTDDLKADINLYSRNVGFGKHPSYLVMNLNTFYAIKDSHTINLRLDTGGVKRFWGIPIAISECLEDYDIDIVG